MTVRIRVLPILVALSMLAAAASVWAGGQTEKRSQIIADGGGQQPAGSSSGAVTPIDHVVVIFDENISFDHYFGTYPHAENPVGEPPFFAAPDTPSVNGLDHHLLTDNPNGVNPARLDRSQALTADMDHGYTAEQKAADGGLMDRFVSTTGRGKSIVMDYYDGNTVTALWNYAQHFAMSDNSFGTTFGPSSPGAINLVAGQTHGATAYSGNVTTKNRVLQPGQTGYPAWALNSNGTLFSDVDPYFDVTSKGATIMMSGRNVGDLLNAHKLTWGWFEGGFADATKRANVGGHEVTDYIPHHEPFQYYKQTANPNHLPPTSIAMIGHSDQANHQYDLTEFFRALAAGNLPDVSYLKAPAAQDGHAGYSDPIDEQHWLVDTINKLQKSPFWAHTAVFISWDDSDGWYDHVMGPIVTASNDPKEDALVGPGNAGTPAPGTYLDRAGYGPRLPLLLVSPWARHNYVAHSISDQSSILKFIEDNWKLGTLGNQSTDAIAGSLDDMFDFSKDYRNGRLFLDPTTGEPVAQTAVHASGGRIIMNEREFAQSLDVVLEGGKNDVFFVDGAHLVVIPDHGSQATVDGVPVALDGSIDRTAQGIELPVERIARALGLEPVRVSDTEYLFRPVHG